MEEDPPLAEVDGSQEQVDDSQDAVLVEVDGSQASQDPPLAEVDGSQDALKGLSQDTLIMGDVGSGDDEAMPPLEAPEDSQIVDAESPSIQTSECPWRLQSGDEGEEASTADVDDGDGEAEKAREDSPMPAPKTPERREKPWPEWNDRFFTSPQFGNGGPKREEVVEMCIGLMQYLTDNHPHVMKCLGI